MDPIQNMKNQIIGNYWETKMFLKFPYNKAVFSQDKC